jgi:hypothetical protein
MYDLYAPLFFDEIEVRSWQRRHAIDWVEAYISSWVSRDKIYPEPLVLFKWNLDYQLARIAQKEATAANKTVYKTLFMNSTPLNHSKTMEIIAGLLDELFDEGDDDPVGYRSFCTPVTANWVFVVTAATGIAAATGLAAVTGMAAVTRMVVLEA